MGRRARRSRGGTTFLEAVATMIIFAVLAAVVAPSVVGMLDRARVDAGLDALEALVDATDRFENDVRAYPGRLQDLTEPITDGDVNSCGEDYSMPELGRWAGPYLNQVVPATGLPASVGMANDTLVRSPPIVDMMDVEAGLLFFRVDGVDEADLLEMDEEVDGSDGSAGGSIRWDPPDATGLATVYYVMPISGC